MKRRSMLLAILVIRFCNKLPNKPEYWIITKQVIRSSSSVGANYRAAYKAKSKKDFAYKLSIVIEEADKTVYWFELLLEIVQEERTLNDITKIIQETKEILAIAVSSRRTITSK